MATVLIDRPAAASFPATFATLQEAWQHAADFYYNAIARKASMAITVVENGEILDTWNIVDGVELRDLETFGGRK